MSRLLTLHICNTFFEMELESSKEMSLAAWMCCHPVIRQLQTFPLQYIPSEDLILVSELPKHPDPCFRLINAPISAAKIEDWGASRAIAAWAKERNIPYAIPDWETIRTINSKIFSFTHSPMLPFADLLHNEKEALDWIEKTPGRKVLKTAFGTAGRGHFFIPGKGSLTLFLKKEFAKNLPLIGEPWVERVFDFSTQWKGSLLQGATVFENTPKGSYRGTFAGPESQVFGSYEWALKEHLALVQPLLTKIRTLGFFGNLGIDAYVYRWKGQEVLQPIVEINGRKTMGWAALQIQKKCCPGRSFRFSFSPERGISFGYRKSRLFF